MMRNARMCQDLRKIKCFLTLAKFGCWMFCNGGGILASYNWNGILLVCVIVFVVFVFVSMSVWLLVDLDPVMGLPYCVFNLSFKNKMCIIISEQDYFSGYMCIPL